MRERDTSSPYVLDDRRNPSRSPYLASGAPTQCARCGAEFGLHRGLPACWRGADRAYYCTEACASAAPRSAA